MLISKEEYQSLLKQEGFILYRKYLQKLREDIKETWAKGYYTDPNDLRTLQLTSEAVGRVSLLEHLLSEDMSYEQIMETLSE